MSGATFWISLLSTLCSFDLEISKNSFTDCHTTDQTTWSRFAPTIWSKEQEDGEKEEERERQVLI